MQPELVLNSGEVISERTRNEDCQCFSASETTRFLVLDCGCVPHAALWREIESTKTERTRKTRERSLPGFFASLEV